MNRTVLVGSANPTKVEAVRRAFDGVLHGPWKVHGRAVASRVSDQPTSEAETVRGARNRVAALISEAQADYYVGIEGGLLRSAGRWMECGWVVIEDAHGHEGIASTASIMIPTPIAEQLLDDGANLNDACATHFDVQDAGKQMGYFGLMTNGMVDRVGAYADAAAFALAPFAHPALFASPLPPLGPRERTR